MNIKICVFILLFYSTWASPIVGDGQTYMSELLDKIIDYRLPSDVIPLIYKLDIEPHIDDEEFTFDGESTVKIEVREPTRDITMHASTYLEIDKSYTKLIGSNGTIWTPVSQRFNSILEFFNVRFDHEIAVGRYSLKLKWKGHDAETMRGFYRSADTDSNGNSIFVAATHFQATAARRAFPCWDEPGLKAEFEVTLIHYKNYTALSNMGIRNEVEIDDNKIRTNFEKTPIMSTYLVTFVVGDYDHISNQYGNITFYAHTENLDGVKLSLNISHKVITYMENYTGIPYSLPKLDAVHIPRYSSSATEHWGTISYSFPILYDESKEGVDRRDTAIYLTAHEISHMWFGNLVTPAWWDDLWLSEAFAVYFSYKICDQIMDFWNTREIFVYQVVNGIAYRAEQMQRTTHPTKWYPKTAEEIRQMFGPVTYRKGAAILHMLETIVTEEVFRLGISKYLYKHRYGVVTTDDLLTALEEAYEEKGMHPYLHIKLTIMPYLEQSGYPMLNVTRDYEGGFANVTQSNALDPSSDYLWEIPTTIATKSHPDFDSTRFTHWIPRSNETYTFYGIDKNDWIILNVQQTGFHRVNYDYENWKRLVEYLNTDDYDNIHVINRAQLIADLLSISKQDHNDTYFDLLFDLMTYLHRETNSLPWLYLADMIDYMNRDLINTSVYDLYERYMLFLLNNIVHRLGFDSRRNEDHLDTLGRETIVRWACFFDHDGCKITARAKLIEHLKDPEKKPLSWREEDWIYCCGLKAANESIWSEVMNSYFANPTVLPGLQYLGCTNNHYLMTQYLHLTLAENSTFLDDGLTMAFDSMITGKQDHVDFALDFFANHIDPIREYYNLRNTTYKIDWIIDKFSDATKNSDQYNKFVDLLTLEEKKGKVDRVDEVLSRAKEAMISAEQHASLFYTKLANRTSLFDTLNKSHFFTDSFS